MISVNIIKVLGEGGFSFVYLAQDEISGVRDPISLFLTTSHIHVAAIRSQKNKMSYWVRGCQGGYARSRGIQTFQVSQACDGCSAVSSMPSDIEISFGYL